ncbi:MAG: pyruvate kinase [Deltaproteobacteria bacterium]|nr:pyruvate kinase [Deltaproteobacteria bacterium]
MANKTKIVATIGPSSSRKAVLRKMISAGMNVARLNFSHGGYTEHEKVIKHIRSLSEQMGKPVGILLDLQGPKIRTGKLVEGKPVFLKRNATIEITTRDVDGGPDGLISTTYKRLPKDVGEGDTILIDDGMIELRVLSVTKNAVNCKVIQGGVLKEHKGINLPGIPVSVPSLTEKDKRDLAFGIRAGVDYIALSFVRRANDVKRIKSEIEERGSEIPVIAKIEKPEAVSNLDRIMEIADGVMIARGDLGVEIKPEEVPTIQKRIIRKAISSNKPVITATQMLETMIEHPVPTRAEASDVANAIIDGTDAIMLSGETAVGRYPLKAVRMMSRIAAVAEGSPFMHYNLPFKRDPKDLVPHAVAQSAVDMLHELNAKAIIVFSVSGKTSKLISKQRPAKPVFSFSPSMKVYNRLSLIWGITPFLIPSISDAKKIIQAGEDILVEKRFLKQEDLIIIVTGLALKKGSTNMIKIHRVGHDD